ncbi:hypothetical protein [Paracoccus litorisediminis]|uniref:Uncharacterized protein n=1 Tax=Paracoccus litorisediminis TaxID=2006130 RepID=A0A844HTB7_9RHOB|nr:hypothetical protein [Paracoccus litorisediminis]MTH61465.1 hypothetical protein [Paracoccus litorisediminis]
MPLEAVKGVYTEPELAAEVGVSMNHQWKKSLNSTGRRARVNAVGNIFFGLTAQTVDGQVVRYRNAIGPRDNADRDD